MSPTTPPSGGGELGGADELGPLQDVVDLAADQLLSGPAQLFCGGVDIDDLVPLTYSKVGHIVMGTGNVEGTIKQLGARMKGPGMRWSVEWAERVLALRCLQLSDNWKVLAARAQERHEALTSLHVPAISSSEILTAHKSVRKAA